MWTGLQATLIVSGISGARYYAGWLAFVAGCFFVLLGAMILLRRGWENSKQKSFSSKLPLEMIALGTVAKVGLESMPVVMTLCILFGMALGYIGAQIEQMDATVKYRIHVENVVGPYRYWVRRGAEQPWMMVVCDDIGDPQFEIGDNIDVTVRMTGPCMSLHYPNGWVGVPNQARGRTVNLQEATP
jgi:hypothetical protein